MLASILVQSCCRHRFVSYDWDPSIRPPGYHKLFPYDGINVMRPIRPPDHHKSFSYDGINVMRPPGRHKLFSYDIINSIRPPGPIS